MSDKSATSHGSPGPSQASHVRDTLQAIDQLFLHDQLEALLASPTLARVAARSNDSADDSGDLADDSERDDSERDTEPRVDARVLGEALRAGLK